MLRIQQLEQHYGESLTLKSIDLDVPEGACACVMGRNGVGKTTLVRCIMGLEAASKGAIRFRDMDITRMRTERRAAQGIGYVPQGRQVFPTLTVEENILTGLFGNRSRASRGRGIPAHIHALFPVLKDMRRRRGGDLSGGQQQQLAIARALMIDPALLILDEPTEGIQPNLVADISSLIRTLIAEQGLTVLLVEQKLPFIRKTADTVCILDRGEAVAAGTLDILDDALVSKHLTV
ncbi:MAG: urea ABC transporter ATP-binding subunit UrtE [Pseudomonadota bacterium]